MKDGGDPVHEGVEGGAVGRVGGVREGGVSASCVGWLFGASGQSQTPRNPLGRALEVRVNDEFRRVGFDDDPGVLLAKDVTQIGALSVRPE